MNKFSRTWSLMGASWQTLKKDKEMLVFPFISSICCILVLASFALPIIAAEAWMPPTGEEATVQQQVVYYGTLFLFYFCNYFIIIFFNSAVIACAVIRMNGGDPTVMDGFRASFSRLSLIAGWAILSATVGLILRMIEERSNTVGKIVVSIIGMAWTMASFFVIPIMVLEKKGPFTALSDSTAMLKQTWGEQLIGNVSFGLVFFVLAVPAFAIIAVGAITMNEIVIFACIGIAVLYLILLSLVQTTLQSIYQAALYVYVRKQTVPDGFEAGDLQNAMRVKGNRW